MVLPKNARNYNEAFWMINGRSSSVHNENEVLPVASAISKNLKNLQIY